MSNLMVQHDLFQTDPRYGKQPKQEGGTNVSLQHKLLKSGLQRTQARYFLLNVQIGISLIYAYP